jgi:hypothetical protein
MKKLHESKTIWFNAITVIVVFATFFGYSPDQQLAETTSAILVGLAPLVNIILRLVTDKPIKL